MIQTVLLVAVPAIITLTAAFFILRNISKEEEHGRRVFYNSQPSSAQSESRNRCATARDESQLKRGRSRFRLTRNMSECSICYERRAMVEIYPCNHASVCQTCVDVIISQSKLCPFCRVVIKGYRDL